MLRLKKIQCFDNLIYFQPIFNLFLSKLYIKTGSEILDAFVDKIGD